MTLDFGEILTHAWHMTWKHKILWAFGFISMLVGFLFIPLGFAPAASLTLSDDIPVWIEQPAFIFGFFGLFLVLFLTSFVVSSLVQAAISCGLFQAEQSGKSVTFRGVLSTSYPLWGRFLGVTLLYSGGIFLVVFGFSAFQSFVSMVTLGLGSFCMVPLQLLLYPFMMVAYAWYEQSLASIVVDDLGVFEATRRGWQVFRRNVIPLIFMTLIIYLGIGMISAFVSLPILIPLFASLFAGIENSEGSRAIFIISALCGTVYLPVLALLQSIALTFMKSGWLLTYLRLTRNVEPDALVSTSAPVSPS